MMLPAKTPAIVEYLFPKRIWRMPNEERALYLTFDDGPHPRITNNVLDLLAKYNAQATFFCIGHRVMDHPDVYQRLISDGHAVGNHTHHHFNGWKTSDDEYVNDIRQAQAYIDSNLFRPPYGRMSGSQFKQVDWIGMKTIMWTILTGDYEKSLSKEDCAKRTLSNMGHGAIYVFHDSEKAESNMMYALSALLEAGTQQGYNFKKLNTKV